MEVFMVKAGTMVELKPIKIRRFVVTLAGDTPLICHSWCEKAKKQMLDAQMKKAVVREIRNPVREFIESLYWLTPKPETMDEKGFEAALKKKAQFGFPSVAFKAAAVSAGYRAGALKNKVETLGAFHIDAEFVKIKGVPSMREDMVRLNGIGGTADLRYRGEFKIWDTTFEVRYNSDVTSPEILINLFNLGGFSCGIGEMRVEKGGNFGMFHVHAG
jgi:hypothetical protein